MQSVTTAELIVQKIIRDTKEYLVDADQHDTDLARLTRVLQDVAEPLKTGQRILDILITHGRPDGPAFDTRKDVIRTLIVQHPEVAPMAVASILASLEKSLADKKYFPDMGLLAAMVNPREIDTFVPPSDTVGIHHIDASLSDLLTRIVAHPGVEDVEKPEALDILLPAWRQTPSLPTGDAIIRLTSVKSEEADEQLQKLLEGVWKMRPDLRVHFLPDASVSESPPTLCGKPGSTEARRARPPNPR